MARINRIITVEADDAEDQLSGLLRAIKEASDPGHSFSIVVDPGDSEFEKRFSFDGDGADRIISIDVKRAVSDGASHVVVLDSFSTDQPRDDAGKWTAGSGANGPPPGGKFERGDHVVHPAYGHGRVEQVSKSGGTVSVRYPDDLVVPHSSDDVAYVGRDPDYSPPAPGGNPGQVAMNPASRIFREYTPEPLSASTGSWRKRHRNDGPVTILNKDGVEDEPRDDKGQWTSVVSSPNVKKDYTGEKFEPLSAAERETALAALAAKPRAGDDRAWFDTKDEVDTRELGFIWSKTANALGIAVQGGGGRAVGVADVPSDRIIATQSSVKAEGLRAYINGARDTAPVLVEYPSGYFSVAAGHTRIGAQLLAGRKKIRAVIMPAKSREEIDAAFLSKRKPKPVNWSDSFNDDGAPMTIIFNDATGLLDAEPRRTADGYLVAGARVARVGLQKYKGSEVGRPQIDSVVLYRPEEEVFAKDAMASMANKPVTLTHPRKMVDARSWAKVAKGVSGTDVVRDGDFVRVPLMLMDAATIDAYEKDGIKELSVGYMADIDWTPGQTPAGEHYDGVQRAIRANHHALVPVARGGKSLTFGDDVGNGNCPQCGASLDADGDCDACGWEDGDDDLADAAPAKCAADGAFMKDGKCPKCGGTKMADAAFTAEERKDLAKKGEAKPDGSYPIRNVSDLKNAISAWGRGGATASDKAWIIKRARALGATSELPEDWGSKDADPDNIGEDTVIQVLIDGVPIQVADVQQAAILNRHLKALQDAMDESGKTDPDAAAKEQENEKKIRGYKDAIATKDGEIAALRDRLAKATLTDAQQDEIIAQRTAVLDAAGPLLPQGYDAKGQTIPAIRRAAVTAQMGDAAVKDMDDAAVAGAFRAYTSGATKPSGARLLADGMTRDLRLGGNQVPVNDATKAYDDMVARNAAAYKTPITAIRN